MQMILKGRHMKLTPSLKDVVERKLLEPIERLVHSQSARLSVELSPVGESGIHECNAHLTFPPNHHLDVHVTHENMYTAIDDARDALLQRARKVITRRRAHDAA